MKYLNSKWSIPVALIVLSLLVVLLPFYINFQTHNTSPLISDWGSFGDYIGGLLGVIISGIAIFLIWQTYLLQKEELSKTAETINFQNTTQIMFQLLKKKDEVLDSSFYKKKQGIDLINYIAVNAESAFQARRDIEFTDRIIQSLDAATDNHTIPIIKRYVSIIRAIVNILEPQHIDHSKVQKDNYEYLGNIFKDYLTNEEKHFLSYFVWYNEFEETREYLISCDVIQNLKDN